MKKQRKRRFLALLYVLVILAVQTGEVSGAGLSHAAEIDTGSETASFENETGSATVAASGSSVAPEETEAAGSETDDDNIDTLLPYGLTGMHAGFSLSEEEKALKKDYIKHDVVSALRNECREGVDYAENQIFFEAGNIDYAEEVARAYNDMLLSYNEEGIAVVLLDPDRLSVVEAVSAGQDPDLNLPPVSPNYIHRLIEPVSAAGAEMISVSEELPSAGGVPTEEIGWKSWESWEDPALSPDYNFTDSEEGKIKNGYQWMHDAVGSYVAWKKESLSSKITVAVLDTGVTKPMRICSVQTGAVQRLLLIM